ncbi:MAG: hypothetical protein M3O50_11045 [Myxococcota bacterium]|nr:hypothetical protein [Myxococcota bacterium]
MKTSDFVATLRPLAPPGRPSRAATSLAARGTPVSAWLSILALVACTAKSGAPAPVASVSSGLEVPCDARRVLENVCQQCHSNPPRNSAPFPLMTYDDTHAVASGEPLWHYMRIVVKSGVMPLPPVQLGAEDRDTLLRWFEAGAPARAAGDTCAPSVASIEGGADERTQVADSGSDDANAEAESATADAGAPDGSAQADASTGTEGLDASQTDGSSANTDDAAPSQSD